jgi:hypothetical protein
VTLFRVALLIDDQAITNNIQFAAGHGSSILLRTPTMPTSIELALLVVSSTQQREQQRYDAHRVKGLHSVKLRAGPGTSGACASRGRCEEEFSIARRL